MVMLKMMLLQNDIRRKAELLCFGLRRSVVVDEAYEKQNPYDLICRICIDLHDFCPEKGIPNSCIHVH